MYILSLAVLKGVASVCAIITDTGIYCHQRQFMQTAIYADDNSCNMYCRRRQFMQATIYAVTLLRHILSSCKNSDNICRNICPTRNGWEGGRGGGGYIVKSAEFMT